MPDNKGDKLGEFYSVLKQDDVYKDAIGDEASFRMNMMNPSKSSAFFKVLKQDDVYTHSIKDYKHFADTLGLSKVNTLPQLPGSMTAPDNSMIVDQAKPAPLKGKARENYVKPKEKPDFNQSVSKAYDEQAKTEKLKETGATTKQDKADSPDNKWSNWFYQLGGNTANTVYKAIGGLATLVRDYSGQGTYQNGVPVTPAPLYKGEGVKSEYGQSLANMGAEGYLTDPLAKLIVDVNGMSTGIEKEMSGLNLPDTFMGRGTQTLLGIAPDLALSAIVPESKVAEGASVAGKIVKQVLTNPFTKYLGTKEGLTGAKEASQNNESSAIGAIKGTAHGVVEGAKVHMLGGLSGKMSEGSIKLLEKSGIINKAGRMTTGGAIALAETLTWGGHDLLAPVIQGKGFNLKNAESGVFTGLAFGLKGGGSHIMKDISTNREIKLNTSRTFTFGKDQLEKLNQKYQEDAMKNFLNAHPDGIKEVYSSGMKADELNTQAVVIAKKAIEEQNPEIKSKLIAEGQLMRKMADIKQSVENIKDFKQDWVDMIESNKELTPEQKQMSLEKIDLAEQLTTKEKAKFEAEKEIGKHQEEVVSEKPTETPTTEETKPLVQKPPKDYDDWLKQINERLANGEEVEVETVTGSGNKMSKGVSEVTPDGKLVDEHNEIVDRNSLVEPLYEKEVSKEEVMPEKTDKAVSKPPKKKVEKTPVEQKPLVEPVKEETKVEPVAEPVKEEVKSEPAVEPVKEVAEDQKPTKEKVNEEAEPTVEDIKTIEATSPELDVTTSKEETFNNIMRGRKKRHPVDMKDKANLEAIAKAQVKLKTDLEVMRKLVKAGDSEKLKVKFKGVIKRLYDLQSTGILPTESSKNFPKGYLTTGHFERSAGDVMQNAGINKSEVSKMNTEARMELAREIDANEYKGKYFSDTKSETIKEEVKPENQKIDSDTGGEVQKTEGGDSTATKGDKKSGESAGSEKEPVQESSEKHRDKVVEDDATVLAKANQDFEALRLISKDKKSLKHQKSVERISQAKKEGRLTEATFDRLLEKFDSVLPEQSAKIVELKAERDKIYKELRKETGGMLNSFSNPAHATKAVKILVLEARIMGLKVFQSVQDFKQFVKNLKITQKITPDEAKSLLENTTVFIKRVNDGIKVENLKNQRDIFEYYSENFNAGKKRLEHENKKGAWEWFTKKFVDHSGKLKSKAEAEADFKLGKLSISPTAAQEFKKSIDNKAGVSAIVARTFEKAREDVLGKIGDSNNPLLTQKQQDLLAKYVDYKSIIELDTNSDNAMKPRLKHTDGLHKELAEELIGMIERNEPSVVKEHGGYDIADIKKRADAYFDYMHKLLDRRYENNLINKDAYEALNKIKYYSPRSYVEHLNMDGHSSAIGGSDTAGVGSLKGGSEGDKVTNLSKLMQDATQLVESKVAKNNQHRAFWQMFGEEGLSFAQKAPLTPEYIKAVALESKAKADAEALGQTHTFKYIAPQYKRTPKGMKEVDFIDKDGRPKRFWIDETLHDELGHIPKVIEGLDNKASDAFKFFMGSGLTRTLATSANPEFTFVNAIRDMAFIYMTTDHYSKIAPVFAGQIVKDMWKVGGDAFKRKGRFNDMIDQYGAREYISGREMKNTSGGYTGRHAIWNKAKNTLMYISESSEILTRLALRERVISNKLETMSKAGETVTPEIRKQIESDATYEAANYIDFSQGGQVSKAINDWVPFFNAGIQGTRKTFEAAQRDPKLFAVKAGQIALVSMLAYYYNNSDDDRSKFYQTKVPDYIKNNYYVFMAPQSHIDAEGNEIYEFLKIPKSQDQMILGTFAESLANKLLYEKTGEQKYKDADIMNEGRVMASVKGLVSLLPSADALPPAIKGMVAYGWNYDTFRQDKIYKGEQVRPGLESDKHTMKFLESIGKFQYENDIPLEISPARTQGAFKAMVPTKNIWFDALAALGSVGDMTKSKKDIIEGDKKLELDKAWITRRFVGKTDDRPDYDGIETANIEANSERKINSDAIDEAFVKFDKGDISLSELIKSTKEIADGDGAERERLLDRIMDARKDAKLKKKSTLRGMKGLFKSTDASTQYFYNQWLKMNEVEQKALIRDLKKSGFYTDDFAYKWRILKKKNSN